MEVGEKPSLALMTGRATLNDGRVKHDHELSRGDQDEGHPA
jgi:hypothetical protein